MEVAILQPLTEDQIELKRWLTRNYPEIQEQIRAARTGDEIEQLLCREDLSQVGRATFPVMTRRPP